MDWYQFAKSDGEVYHDIDRIKVYVQKEKITLEQFTDITEVHYIV